MITSESYGCEKHAEHQLQGCCFCELERLRALRDKLADVFVAEIREGTKLGARLAEARAMLTRYASECGECAGVGITIDDEPCEDCADVRALLG